MILPNNTNLQNRYLIVRLLGQGGFGAVYEARHLGLGHRVALKQLTLAGPQVLKAFEREARILARLKHPALPKVTDYFVDSNAYFLVMEYIEGDDFEALLKQRTSPFPVSDVLEWADQLLDALDYLHRQQPPVIHRDIKPANIKLSKVGGDQGGAGQIYLLDFGISKGGQTHTYQTMSGRSIHAFSQHYASMEQIEGKGTDARSDLYSLAVTLHHLLTKQKPPQTVSRANAKAMNRADPLPPMNELNPQVPVKVAQVLTSALNFDPNLRPQSARAMRQMLKDAIAAPQPPPRPPIYEPPTKPPTSLPLPWLVGVGILLLLVGLLGGRVLFGGASDASTTASLTPLPTALPTLQRIDPTYVGLPTSVPTATPLPTETAVPPAPDLVAGATRIAEKDGMVQVYVPEGDFEMGSAEDDPDASDDEKPRHTVYLDAFWMDQTEVTNAQYALCVADGACEAPSSNRSSTRDSYYGNAEFNNYPVMYVSWNDATAYCEWAERALPTEAQWEKAAGGVSTEEGSRKYPWGNDAPNDTLVNFDFNVGDTTPVGNYPAGASPYGAYDMAGNLWEWVFDEYDSNYYASSPGENPTGASISGIKVRHGGAWYLTDIRVRFRGWNYASRRNEVLGFRCARSPYRI